MSVTIQMHYDRVISKSGLLVSTIFNLWNLQRETSQKGVLMDFLNALRGIYVCP